MRAALVDPAQAGFTATQDPIRGSRRHLEMAGGVPAEWRPSRVVLTEPVREERPTGKRVPPPEVGGTYLLPLRSCRCLLVMRCACFVCV